MKLGKVLVSLAIVVAVFGGGFLYVKSGITKGVQAYLYAYPMVMMSTTRDATVDSTRYNAVNHSRSFPDHNFRRVVRPNVDTLYSTIWFDLTAEPAVLELPDSGGRYYLMPIHDAWTNVTTSIGSRTTGNGPQGYLVAGPNWSGDVPEGLTQVTSPTNTAWAIGRSDTAAANADGSPSDDMKATYEFQSAMSVTPLSRWLTGVRERQETMEPIPGVNRQPAKEVAAMDAEVFYTTFYSFLQGNPAPADDAPFWNTIMKPFGFVDPNTPESGQGISAGWSYSDLSALDRWLLEAAYERIPSVMEMIGKARKYDETGWANMPGAGVPLGRYGTNYGLRAYVAHIGLGANEAIDAVYPGTNHDFDGVPLNGNTKYKLHFKAGEMPPVKGFWSLTLYDADAYLFNSDIKRYAVGGRDALRYNADGSLDLFIQAEPPADPADYANWLPSPKGEPFALNMRLYWPEKRALDGFWKMPTIEISE